MPTPIVDTTYATLADLKALLTIKVSSSVSDTLLQQYLNDAAEAVDTWTRGYRPGLDADGNRYEAFSAVTETRSFDDDLTGTVPVDDLLSISTLTRAQSTVGTDYYKLWPYNRTPAEAVYFRADLAFEPVVVGGTWYQYPYGGRGLAAITILGSWGYCTAATRPARIKAATLRIAAWAYEQAGIAPKDKLLALRDPTKPFYWEIDQLLVPFKRASERSGVFG